MTDYAKERMADLAALHEVDGSDFRAYLGRQLVKADALLRTCPTDIEIHRLQGRAQFIEELCREIDGAYSEICRLKSASAKPNMSKAF